MDENLKTLQEIVKLLDKNVSKQDFVTSFEQVLKLVVQIEQKTSQAITSLQQTYAQLLQKMQNDHAQNYNDLKGQVDNVFVGNQVESMKKEHSERMKTIDDKISKIKNGKTPTKDELISLIKPLIPPPKQGLPGRTEKLPEIEEGLNKLHKRMKKQESRQFVYGAVAGRDLFQDVDISAQFNGVLTTFNIPGTWSIINVSLSSYPYGSLRKNIDYSYTMSTITFLSTIDASTQLSAGQQCVLTVVRG